MAPVPPAAFRTLLATRSRAAFGEFVAALWRARGRPVERDGDALLVGDADPTVLYPVATAAPDPDRPVDAFVLAEPGLVDGGSDARILGPDDLRGALLYDLPREEAASLFETHFERSLTGWDEPDAGGPVESAAGGESPDGGATGPTLPTAAQGALAAVALIAVLLAGGAAAPTGPADADAIHPAGDAAWQLVLDRADGRTVAGTTAGETPTTGDGYSGKLRQNRYPPGLARTGVYDASALAAAHEEAVTGRSYRLVVSYREARGGNATGEVREIARVRSPIIYVSDRQRRGALAADPAVVAANESYANGETEYRRRSGPDGPTYTAGNVFLEGGRGDRFASRVASLVRRLAAGGDTAVLDVVRRDGGTYWRVAVDYAPGLAILTVDGEGVVHSLRWEFSPPDHPEVTATVEVRYRFGDVAVERPDWYGAARNATGVNDTVDRDPTRLGRTVRDVRGIQEEGA